LIPKRLTALTRRKILDTVVNVVSKALSMHAPPGPYGLMWYRRSDSHVRALYSTT
jgi:hypothetical protein